MSVEKQKILIIDDDIDFNNMITEYLQNTGFEVISAFNGKEAVEKEEATRPDLVIVDVKMPVMDGFEVCKIIRAKRKGLNYIPIIFLSGLIDEELVLMGLNFGADDYLRKPVSSLEMVSRINNLLKMKNFITQLDSLENITTTMLKSIEARDFYTAGHSQRVTDLAVQIGREMGISETDKKILHQGAMLHDIGKIGVADQILNKADKLTEEEFNKIKNHPTIGAEICSNLRFSKIIIEIIQHHHEKLDGSGYPDRLRGNEILEVVKIVTVADIYDALTTERPYRGEKNKKEVIFMLEKEAQEGKLDAAIVNCIKKLKPF